MSQILLPPLLYRKDWVAQFDEMRTSPVEFIGTTISRLLDGRLATTARRPTRSTSRARSGDTTANHVKCQQHSLLPGRRSGRPPGRRWAQPVERMLCVQQWQPRRRVVVALPGSGNRGGRYRRRHLGQEQFWEYTRAINSCQRRARRATTIESYSGPRVAIGGGVDMLP